MTDRVRSGRLAVGLTMFAGGMLLMFGLAGFVLVGVVVGVLLLVLAGSLITWGFAQHVRVMRWSVEDGVPLGRDGMGGYGHGGGEGDGGC